MKFPLLFCLLFFTPAFASLESFASVSRVSFETLLVGSLDAQEIREVFGAKSYQGDGRIAVVQDDASESQALQVFYPKGKVKSKDSGAQWKWKIQPSQEVFASYRVKFDEDFDFVKGGKLPGVCGGDCNSGGNVPTGYDGWSARMMWRADGRLEQYVYHPEQPGTFGHQFAWMHEPPVITLDQTDTACSGVGQQNPCYDSSHAVFVQLGVWHEITERVRVNDVGAHNGEMQAWLDGELVLDVRGIEFVKNDHNTVDAFYFSTFFGGSDASWAPVKDEVVFFDDFEVRGL